MSFKPSGRRQPRRHATHSHDRPDPQCEPIQSCTSDDWQDDSAKDLTIDDPQPTPQSGSAPAALTGQALRSLAFTLLARREYSRHELRQRLLERALNADEVDHLVDELVASDYQNDERMAGMVLRSQLRQGRGPARVQQALKKHHIDAELVSDEMQQMDWLQQALALKVRKFGPEVARDPKLRARQVRFLQYRGFALDVIMKVTSRSADELEQEFDDGE